MVFTSLPIYLDPPYWNQPNQQDPFHIDEPPPHLMMTTPEQNPQGPTGNGGNSNSSNIRPGSMTERARLAKIPQPEVALRCPRCDSTNTKFCYFNNYSLSQPRHFCKTCRRYWTRGGSLRSIPVGGGCRRNRRSSSSKSGSKSGASASSSSSSKATVAAAAAASSSSVTCSGSTVIPSNFSLHHQLQLPFLGSANLHLLIGGDQFGMQSQPLDAVDNYQPGLGLGLDQWRIQQIQQFPFLGGMDGSSVQVHHGNNSIMYNPNFDGGDQLGFSTAMSNKVPSTSATTASAIITQMASVKMEDSGHHQQQIGLDLARHYLGIQGSNTADHYLSGGNGGWGGDLSGFNSSSSGNIL